MKPTPIFQAAATAALLFQTAICPPVLAERVASLYGQALDQTSVIWSGTGPGVWSLVTDEPARPDILTATATPESGPSEGPILNTTLTGPLKMMFDWAADTPNSDATTLGFSVDGHEVQLQSFGPDWRRLECQIPAGDHVVQWRPLERTTLKLDNVVLDRGQTMAFSRAIGDENAVWLINAGTFAQVGASARDGFSSSAQVLPDGQGRAWAYRLSPANPGEVLSLVYWEKVTPSGLQVSGSPTFSVGGRSYEGTSTWICRETVVQGGPWIDFAAFFTVGLANAGSIFFDDVSVQPWTLGAALDSPNLPWTVPADGPEWSVQEGAAPVGRLGSGGAVVMAPQPAVLQTEVAGPARLTAGFGSPGFNGIDWSISVGQDTVRQWTADDAWNRQYADVPAGTWPVTFSANRPGEPSLPLVLMDQVNVLVPAAADVSAALGSSGEAVWISQNGTVTKDNGYTHGDDASLRLLPASGQIAEVMLDATGPSRLSLWVKRFPGSTLSFWLDGVLVEGLEAPALEQPWQLRTFGVPAGASHLHIVSSSGVSWIDGLAHLAELPLAEALDFETDLPDATLLDAASLTAGFSGSLPAGSGAVGNDAVILDQAYSELQFPFTRYPARIRFRHSPSTTFRVYEYADGSIQSQAYYINEPPAGPWTEVDMILAGPFGEQALNRSLGFFTYDGPVMLDHLRVHALRPRPFAEANIPIDTTRTVNWSAFDGADRNNGVCVTNGPGANASDPARLALDVTGACSIDGLWRCGRLGDLNFRLLCGPMEIFQRSMKWAPFHIHLDRAAATELRVDGAPYGYRPSLGGEGLADDVTITPAPPMSFSAALDTESAEAAIVSPGWTAIGSGVAATTTVVTSDGVDAVSIKTDPAFTGPQEVTLAASFQRTGFLSFRVRRGQADSTKCDLTLSNTGGFSATQSLPLTQAWTTVRTCVNGPEGSISKLSFVTTLDGNSPTAAFYIDSVTWSPVPDIAGILETQSLTGWTFDAAGEWTRDCAVVLNWAQAYPFTTSASVLNSPALQKGTSAAVEATVQGPGVLVFTYCLRAVPAPGITFKASLDGQDAWIQREYGYWSTEQGFLVVPPGTHSVRWTVASPYQNVTAGELMLASVALAPGTPEQIVAERLPASEGWRMGGGVKPMPFFRLWEGLLKPGPVGLPGGSDPAWVERDVSGPVSIKHSWYWDWEWSTAIGSDLTIDGLSRGMPEEGSHFIGRENVVTHDIHLPVGSHRMRWRGPFAAQGIVMMEGFDVGPATIDPQDIGPNIWVNQGFSGYRWMSVTGRPATGATALSARDRAVGDLLVQGPGEVSFVLAQDGRSIFSVQGASGESLYYSSDAHSYAPVTIQIPPGSQRLTFMESYCEPTDGTEIAWVDDLVYRPKGYALWRSEKMADPRCLTADCDTDGDGAQDFLEFAFGTDPNTSGGVPTPQCSATPNGTFRVQLPALPYDVTGLTYLIEISEDLEHWSTVDRMAAVAAPAEGPVVLVTGPGPHFVRVTAESQVPD